MCMYSRTLSPVLVHIVQSIELVTEKIESEFEITHFLLEEILYEWFYVWSKLLRSLASMYLWYIMHF